MAKKVYKVYWKIEGINYVNAENEEDAKEQFDKIPYEDLGLKENDYFETEIIDIIKEN